MSNTQVIEKIKENIEVKEPKMFKVLLHNDDSTTMDFVIVILTSVFHRKVDEAIQITMHIHNNGQGIAGSPYTKEIAEEKTLETISLARANGFPLVATFEEL